MQSERFLSLFTKEKGEAGGVDSNISVSSKKLDAWFKYSTDLNTTSVYLKERGQI